MVATRTHRRPRSRATHVVHKPRGAFHPRVQKVGPEHFGIVCVDCAKARSKWMLCDFYGKVLIPPTVLAHNRPDLEAAVVQLRQGLASHQIQDLIVAIERTGRYHRIVQHAFSTAGFETRIVHPFATKQFRQPCDPGNKTDDTDLSAIHRAAVNGLALVEAVLDQPWQTLQLLTRHRRDLVFKSSTLCCQIREHLEAALPGYAACFDDLWKSELALRLVRHCATPADFLAAGRDGLSDCLRQQGVRFQRRTLEGILAWAAQAATPEVTALCHQRIALALEGDRQQKTLAIQALERELAGRLAQTAYVLLLSFPGINVVSAAEFAGEMGPITLYANSRTITGRAGLRPSRYQSDQVDRPNGPLLRCANRRLRAAILLIADNLIKCNHHFNAAAHRWQAAGKDPRHTRVKVALRFVRIAFHMVAGGQVFRHPAIQGRHYILDKLSAFHRAHDSSVAQVLADMQAALAHIPRKEYAAEARPLHEELLRIEQGHRRGPQLLGDILPIVLARLGVGGVQSTASGEQDPH